MATVTVLTAARMLAIEAASVVSGAISGDNLILTKYDGSTINAGNVRGTSGTNGTNGTSYTVGDPIYTIARNATGSTIPKGSVVYISGSNGTHPNISLARADAESTSARTLGFTAAAIANNATGSVMVSGYLDGLDTSAAVADGDPIYLSGSTAGGWTTTKPVAPTHLVYLGNVVTDNASTGKIYVKVQNGYELDELHDVLITSKANGDLLSYDSATTLWKNLGKGSTGQVLTAGASTISWATPSSGGYSTVQDESTTLTARSTVNFTGPGVVASDNSYTTSTDVKVYGPYAPAINTGQMIAPLHMPSSLAWTTTVATTLGIRCFPVWLQATSYSGLSYSVSSAGSGSQIRMAVYNHNAGTFAPSTQVAGTEVVASITATGNLTANFSSVWSASAEGYYWIYVVLDGGTAQLRTMQVLALSQLFATTSFPVSEASAGYDIYYTPNGTTTLPANGNGRVGPWQTNNLGIMPAVGIRKA